MAARAASVDETLTEKELLYVIRCLTNALRRSKQVYPSQEAAKRAGPRLLAQLDVYHRQLARLRLRALQGGRGRVEAGKGGG